MASRYHQVPRDSIDSDRDDAHEYLIPSPHNEVNEDAPTKGKQYSINLRIASRVFSCMCSVTGFILMILIGGYTFIPSSVFMMITLIFNIYMLLYAAITHVVTLSIYYQGRDLLDFGTGTFASPGVSSYLDLLAGIGIFIPLTIAMAENHHSGSPVAPAIMGYFVIATQAILAIPALGDLKLTFTRVQKGSKAKRSYRIRKDRKISLMGGARDVEAAEPTAIPAPLVEREPEVEAPTTLV